MRDNNERPSTWDRVESVIYNVLIGAVVGLVGWALWDIYK
jgi:hypothetical protein